MVQPPRATVKAQLAWRWWRLHRRWARLRAVRPHWRTLMPTAPSLAVPRRAVLTHLTWTGTLLLAGETGLAALSLAAVVIPVVIINRARRWSYRGLLRELQAQGHRWHEEQHVARARADLAAWRCRAYPLRTPSSPDQPGRPGPRADR